MRLAATLAVFLSATSVAAHEMTPTYPKAMPSGVSGVVKYEMSLFNARSDVDYYEIGVFDKDWNPTRFATTSKILHVEQGERVMFDVYIRRSDVGLAAYLCSKSKLVADGYSTPVVASVICSRIDGELP